MTRADLKDNVEKTLEEIKQLFQSKGDEYAKTDAFHNFNRAAELHSILQKRQVTPYEALCGMQMKHTISLSDLYHDYEMIMKTPDVGVFSEDYINKQIEMLEEKGKDFLVYEMLKLEMIKEFWKSKI